jgi:hypothetical protein
MTVVCFVVTPRGASFAFCSRKCQEYATVLRGVTILVKASAPLLTEKLTEVVFTSSLTHLPRLSVWYSELEQYRILHL